MTTRLKALVGALAVGFTATGWGLFIAKVGQEPEKVKEVEEKKLTEAPREPKASLDGSSQYGQGPNPNRLVWEINTRDGIIDYKNEQIKHLESEIENREQSIKSLTQSVIDQVNKNLHLRKQLAEWEKYADENEEYMDWLETQIKKLDKEGLFANYQTLAKNYEGLSKSYVELVEHNKDLSFLVEGLFEDNEDMQAKLESLDV